MALVLLVLAHHRRHAWKRFARDRSPEPQTAERRIAVKEGMRTRSRSHSPHGRSRVNAWPAARSRCRRVAPLRPRRGPVPRVAGAASVRRSVSGDDDIGGQPDQSAQRGAGPGGIDVEELRQQLRAGRAGQGVPGHERVADQESAPLGEMESDVTGGVDDGGPTGHVEDTLTAGGHLGDALDPGRTQAQDLPRQHDHVAAPRPSDQRGHGDPLEPLAPRVVRHDEGGVGEGRTRARSGAGLRLPWQRPRRRGPANDKGNSPWGYDLGKRGAIRDSNPEPPGAVRGSRPFPWAAASAPAPRRTRPPRAPGRRCPTPRWAQP